jgi:D-alanyl-D-alanine carboxypeptidase
MLSFHDRAWWAFHEIGWEWGGSWSWPTDYQHFSATNR